LVESGIAAAKKAASNRIESFSDKLQQRAETMRGADTTTSTEAGEPEKPTRRQRLRQEPARREQAREPEPNEASADHDDYEDYEGQEPESGYREEPRPARRPTPTETRRRAPRRDDDRPRRGRAPR
jgi:Mg-chelatase subunit ChlI